MNTFYNPVRTHCGNGCLESLQSTMLSLQSQCERILILTWDQSFIETEKYKMIENQLKKFQLKTISYSLSNPDINDLYEIYLNTKQWNADLIIAIGGGSVLDIGKSLACLYGMDIKSKEELRKQILDKSLKKPKCNWIGIPTTFGTGSEVTCWATIWDRELKCKLSLENKDNYAYAVFVDPEFAKSMPMKLMTSSALDAVAHAIEAYWANGSNLVSKMFALKSISTIMEGIEDMVKNHNDIKYHENMAEGSMLAGFAFSNTKTTACHAISYPLTLRYKIPHGVAVSMLIYPVMKINEEVLTDTKKLYDAFQTKKSDDIDKKIKDILKNSKIPYRLHEWGVKEDEIEDLAEMCFTKGRIDNNPVKLTKENVVNILKSIY